MERTTGFKLTARLFQLYAPADDFDNIGTRDQVINKVLRNFSSHSVLNGNSAQPGL
jgi:hypothetical protein